MAVTEQPVTVMTCPLRLQSTDERIRARVGIDFWVIRNFDLMCSYCGGMHPEDFMSWCSRAAEPDSRVIIDTSETPGKLYIYRRGITNQSMGAIKFYSAHFEDTDDEAVKVHRMRVIGTAIERSVARRKPVR